MGFLQDMVVYGVRTRYGVVWPSYKIWCCMGFLQDVVLYGALTRSVLWGVVKVGLACLVAFKNGSMRQQVQLLNLASNPAHLAHT